MAITTSKTQIANLALSHIRDKSVLQDVDTEQSPQAKVARLWYDPARRQALVDFDHGFARKRAALTIHSEDPPATWAFRYQQPAGALKCRALQNPLGRQAAPIPFETEEADDGTLSILTDAEDAVLIYTKDTESVVFFPPYFVLALSYLLAHYIAGPLTGKQSIQTDALQKYAVANASGRALEANATADGTDELPDAAWITQR